MLIGGLSLLPLFGYSTSSVYGGGSRFLEVHNGGNEGLEKNEENPKKDKKNLKKGTKERQELLQWLQELQEEIARVIYRLRELERKE